GLAWLRVEDHADVDHAAVRFGAVGSLHEDAGGVQADVATGHAGAVAVPLPATRGAEHDALRQQFAEPFPGRLSGVFDRRFADAQAGQLLEAALGDLAETLFAAGQGGDFLGGQGLALWGQAERLVPREVAVVAVVVGTREANVTQQAGESL